MGRRKMQRRDGLLTHPIRTRVTEKTFHKLEELVHSSDTNSIGELTRKILSGEKFTCYYKDNSLNAPMEELSAVKKELNAIGVNINQVTKYFNGSDDKRKLFHVWKLLDLYTKLDVKMIQLQVVVNELSARWLQK